MLVPHDDLRHDLGDDPLARESLYFNFGIDDERLILIAYFFVDAAGETGVLGIALDEDTSRPLALEVVRGVAFEGDDLDAFTAGPLRVAQPDPLKTARVTFAGDQLAFEVEFVGRHAAFDFASHPNGCPEGTATNRFEQGGSISGTFRVAGRSGTFASRGWRDHSWGPRDWARIQHYKLLTILGDDFTVCAFELFAAGEREINGFLAIDGLVQPVMATDIRTEYDDDHHQEDVLLRASGVAGRLVRARGERLMGGRIPFGGEIVMAGCRFDVDGRPARGNVEYFWPAGYREHLASRL